MGSRSEEENNIKGRFVGQRSTACERSVEERNSIKRLIRSEVNSLGNH